MNWQSVLSVGSALGRRFSLVGVLPAALLAMFVISLVRSGAPQLSPSPGRLISAARDLTAVQAVLLALAILLMALLTQPLQRPLVRVFEGYWAESPHCPAWLSMAACRPQRNRFKRLSDLAFPEFPAPAKRLRGTGRVYPARPAEFEQGELDRLASQRRRAGRALARLHSRFPPEDRILPTALGNTLRAAEDSAGQRYGLETVAVWPALYTVLSPGVREVVDDQRDQLDVSVRLSLTLFLCAMASAAMLWRYPYWLAGCVSASVCGACLAYRAAVIAAEGYGTWIGVAFERHRFDLLAALHLPLPADSSAESTANQQLSAYLRRQPNAFLRYEHPGAENSQPQNSSRSPTIPSG
jgi:hypothetical protein